jgi:hypothetical protein
MITEQRSRNQSFVLMLVVVLVLEWAGKLGTEQSCQLMSNAVDSAWFRLQTLTTKNSMFTSSN